MILLSAARAGTSLAPASQGEHTPPVYLYTDHLRVSLLACSKVRRSNEGRADRRTANSR